MIGVHLSEFCGDFCEILMVLVTAWCGMVRGIMAGGLNGHEDGPMWLAVVMVYVGEKPWGLVGNVLESVLRGCDDFETVGHEVSRPGSWR